MVNLFGHPKLHKNLFIKLIPAFFLMRLTRTMNGKAKKVQLPRYVIKANFK